MSKKPSKIDLKSIIKHEWLIIFFGVLLSFVILNIILYHSLFPETLLPLQYRSDNSLTITITQRLTEGWVFTNPRNGFPFTSNYLDYPIPDFSELLFLKILTLFSLSNIQTINLFYLVSFSLCFLSTYIVIRKISLNIFFSFFCALIFNFTPFHFLRFHHLFFNMYFVVPVYIIIAYQIFFDDKLKLRNSIFYIIGAILLGTNGIYYALFGIITITAATIAKSVKNHSLQFIRKGIFANSLIIIGILLASSPYIIHKFTSINNPIAVTRSPVESELYGFKMIQLLLPQDKHRSNKLRKIKEYYNQSFPLNNENTTSSLGLISSLGFLLALISIFLKLSDCPIDPKIQFFSFLTLVYFLFGTIGGLGSLFSNIITPLIRGWNRISIFINFTSLLVFFLYLEKLISIIRNKTHLKHLKFNYSLIGISLLIIALYDQIPVGLYSQAHESNTAYRIDKKFIELIEANIKPTSAIYQLPYIQFPEVPNLYQLESYDLLAGFNYSKSLKWSYGGMKGSKGDQFYQALSEKPLDKQIQIIKKMGFKGIYVDLRGYPDNGSDIKLNLIKLIGPPLLTRDDHQVIFFKLTNKRRNT